MTDKAYAATTDAKSPFDLLKKGADKAGLGVPVPESIQTINDTIDKITLWFKDLPHEIAEMSVNLMSWLYELCAALILKTPLWLFNNEWFENTTYMFSLVSLGVVSVLTIVEAIKIMLSRQLRGKRSMAPMDIKEIGRRWFLVAGVTTAIPWLFQKAFQGLNLVSDFLISMGADTMKAVSLTESIKLFDVLTLVTFDIVLIGTIIPVLWQNARRFFDIMVLGVTAPLALTAWIFDPYRHLFSQWWGNLKHLSLVQVYYALFLLVLGWFIFGVPTPSTMIGFASKLLVVIGGFARMTTPPRLVSKHLDSGGGLGGEADVKAPINKTRANYKKTKALLGGPWSFVKELAMPTPKIVPQEEEKGTKRRKK
jgi:hypothetical protein